MYKIGEVSRMVGISDEGLRFYERSGVIHPIKDERGRRYFKTLDINVLMRIRGYRNMGFSLDQCASMVNDLDAGEVCREFQNQEEELEREIRWRKQCIVHCERIRELAAGMEETMIEAKLVEMPAMYRLEYQVDGVIYEDPKIRGLVRFFTDLSPLACPGSRFRADELGNPQAQARLGMVILQEDVTALNLSIETNEYISYIPRQRAVYCTTYKDSGTPLVAGDIAHGIKKLRELGLEPAGDAYGKVIVSLHKSTNHQRYNQIWIPVAR